jgi:hypothetical protein
MNKLPLTLRFYLALVCLGLAACDEGEPSATNNLQKDTLKATSYHKFYSKLSGKTSTAPLLPDIVDSLPYNTKPTSAETRTQTARKYTTTRPHSLRKLLTITHKTVWKVEPHNTLLFGSGMSIDADGSPRAYHPKNTGLDDLKHAGKNGRWWALATKKGKPVLQKSGYYVSTTSLQDFRYNPWDQRRYVNAEKIPYIVLPPKVKQQGNISLGDIAVVYNTHNGRWAYAIYADTGANTRIGEGSIALARLLGINANARTGGIANGVVYLVFGGSGNGKPRTASTIRWLGKSWLPKLGGRTKLLVWANQLQLSK